MKATALIFPRTGMRGHSRPSDYRGMADLGRNRPTDRRIAISERRRCGKGNIPQPTLVPITGKEISYSLLEAASLPNPLPRTPETLARAERIYQMSCAVCHGGGGRRDGPLASYFQAAGTSAPVDFAGQRVQARKEGELFWIVTNGLGYM
ncbi:MAG: cytochrome c, partial [Chloroflexota bacterium]|nr:cytochrome c [Chloroflexota bacterium]